MKLGINKSETNTRNFGRINHLKKYRHSNYYKSQNHKEEERLYNYYLPLLAWRVQNLVKIKTKELKEV